MNIGVVRLRTHALDKQLSKEQIILIFQKREFVVLLAKRVFSFLFYKTKEELFQTFGLIIELTFYKK